VPPDVTQIKALPKVVLHDHLDGGLRPQTIIELAESAGHRLPATDPEALGRWFCDQANSGSLPVYLTTFDQTLAVMQTADNLARVAREAVIDLANDGVVHAELRFAPEQHTRGGLGMSQAVSAVLAGLSEGAQEATTAGQPITTGLILCAMRQANNAPAVAELALAKRQTGVVGFDLAGPEAGFRPSLFVDTLRRLRLASFPVTLHAGEADAAASVAEAIHLGGAIRVGHGVRLIDDIGDPLDPTAAQLGPLAHWVRDQAIALEMCPTSNLQTGAAKSYAAHPITALHRLGFTVTINCDNRLVSGTSMSAEMSHLVEQAGWELPDLAQATLNAASAAFLHHDARQDLIDNLIVPRLTVLP